MAAGEWIGGVDVSVARDAERGCVGFARDVSGGLFADLAEQDSLVARGEFVSRVDFSVALAAEKRRVRAAVQSRGRGSARVAQSRRHLIDVSFPFLSLSLSLVFLLKRQRNHKIGSDSSWSESGACGGRASSGPLEI